jgi:hypothetical protein
MQDEYFGVDLAKGADETVVAVQKLDDRDPLPAPVRAEDVSNLEWSLRHGTVWLHRSDALREPCQMARADLGPNARGSRRAMGQRTGRRARAVGRALNRFIATREGLRLRMEHLAALGALGATP